MELALNSARGWKHAVDRFVMPLARQRTPLGLWQALQVAPRPAVAPAVDALQQLPRGATLAIGQALGQEVFCLSGTLWITHDDDPRDHILEAGAGHRIDTEGRTLIHALADARFVVELDDC